MDIFIARQPIFDQDQEVFAYELLYRSGMHNYYDHTDGDHATSAVLDNSFFSIGMEKITGGKLAFVNFTDNLLVQGLPSIFPKEQVAIEILETVVPTPEVIERCQAYKECGYLLVLDDVVFRPELQPLVDLADIIKIDFQMTKGDERFALIKQIGSDRIKFLAERVETIDEFNLAREHGFTYFQGYFFARPDVISGKKTSSYQLNYLRILQQINRSDLDFAKIEKIFKQDVALSYKLMRYINSSYFGLPHEVKSIKHALRMIGLREARKWLSLIALSSLGKGKSDELVRMSLLRANMCELLAPLFNLREQKDELFLMGLFSLLDAFLDQPMKDALADLPLSEPIALALLGQASPYRFVHRLVVAYERGEWDRVFDILSDYDAARQELPELFFQTLDRSQMLYPA